MSFPRAEQPVVLKGMEAARAFLAPSVTGDRADDWWVAHVDERVRCIRLAAYPRETDGPADLQAGAILGDALRLGSTGVLVASRANGETLADLLRQAASARKLVEAGEALDVAVLDHLVFGADDCLSARRSGLL